LDRLAAGESLDDIVIGYHGRVSREAIIEANEVGLKVSKWGKIQV
jgi:hypothetical protein